MRTTSTFVLGLLALVFLGSGAFAQAPGCPFTGITTTSYGTGTGVCSDSVLNASLDPLTCQLLFGYDPDPFICGNTYRTQSVLMVGFSQLPFPIPIGDPLIPGSTLLIQPFLFLGPFPSGSMQITLPPSSMLIGASLEFQAIPTYITTVSFPVIPEYGLSTGLTVTLL